MNDILKPDRVSPPTHLETARYLFPCYLEDGTVWVQTSEDEHSPKWIEFHSFEEAYRFIEEMIHKED